MAPNRRIVHDERSFTSLKPQNVIPHTSFNQNHYDNMNPSFDDGESVAQTSVESSSVIAEDDMVPMSQHSTQSRKRKRGTNGAAALSIIKQNHIIYGDQLLDYFMTVGDAPSATRILPPEPPEHFQVDRPIDDQGNTALHWACAMGDLDIVKDLLSRGANVRARSNHDETPLVRAVLFTNNYEKETMRELADLLQDTITYRDWFGATVFNHLAATTRSKGKWRSSVYYCEILTEKLAELFPRHEISLLLSSQDSNGDTAALAAAKNGCSRLASLLLSHCPEAGDLVNKNGENANEVLRAITRRHKDHPPPSSVTHHSIQDGDAMALNHSDNVSPSQQLNTPEVTATLLAKIGAIMEDANKKLALVYGDTKWTPQGAEDITNPQGLFEHVESDRQNIRKQAASLATKEEEGDQLEPQLRRYEKIKRDYESLLEQTQRLDLLKRFQASTTESDHASQSPLQSQSEPTPSKDMAEMYQIARELCQVQKARRGAIKELIQQRADAGVSTKLDVHRKLVSLATGLGEDELDPMSSELADTLEFDRANEKRSSGHTPDVDMDGDQAIPGRKESMSIPDRAM
jgi:ankyrin repeat protein